MTSYFISLNLPDGYKEVVKGGHVEYLDSQGYVVSGRRLTSLEVIVSEIGMTPLVAAALAVPELAAKQGLK